jgi:hypothetical protein
MIKTRRPLNERSIVVYPAGGHSLLFRNYVFIWDIRDACTAGDECINKDEHWTFDGQIFYRKELER